MIYLLEKCNKSSEDLQMNNQLSIQQINENIMFGTWTDEQLNSMVMAIRYNRAQLVKKTKWTLSVGDTVKFVARGREVRGRVIKIMQKNIKVQEGLTVWKVPANMLEAA
jgi:hypothetical protein